MNLTDYRSFLKEELHRRRDKNPQYSLRAFSRDLGLSPSHLAEVISGKHRLSPHSAHKIVKALQLSVKHSNCFLALVKAENGRSEYEREKARLELERILAREQYQINIDNFRTISDWYHLAILSLAELKEFKSCPKWIARRLGITVIECEKAIERLIRVGLLAHSHSKLMPIKTKTLTADTPAQALKNYHSQMLQKAHDSIFDQQSDERDIRALVLNISRNDLPRFKTMIREFYKAIEQEADRGNQQTDVYALTLQLFSLHHKAKEI